MTELERLREAYAEELRMHGHEHADRVLARLLAQERPSEGEIAASMLDPKEVKAGEDRLARGLGVPLSEAVKQIREPSTTEGERDRRDKLAVLISTWVHPRESVVRGRSPLPGDHTYDGCMTCQFFAGQAIELLAQPQEQGERIERGWAYKAPDGRVMYRDVPKQPFGDPRWMRAVVILYPPEPAGGEDG